MSEPATVIALDPGGTTGWAILSVNVEAFTFNDGTSLIKYIRHKDSGQFYGEPNEQADEIGDLFEAWPTAAICLEHFEPRQAHYEVSAIQVETIAEYIAWVDSRDSTLFKQLPSLALSTITDDRLKRWKLYKAGEPHGRDAFRHALMFMRRCCENSGLAKSAWPLLLDGGVSARR